MTRPQLQRECSVFSRYLVGKPAGSYVSEEYRRFHAAGGFHPDRFDRLLIRVASRGPCFARFADTYASRFARRAILRRKLVLLLALLESAPPSSEYIDASRGKGAFLRMAAAAALYLAILLAGILLLAPAHWILSRRQDPA
jgi:hypothetical protein